MKKILAVAVVLLATTTAMFAETSIGVKGILGFGNSNFTYSSKPAIFSGASQETVVNGGFGIDAHVVGAFGKNDVKFLVGFQPGLELVFGRAEKRSLHLLGITTTGELTYNTAEIPLLLTLGARVKKVDINFQLGPRVVIPFGFSQKLSIAGTTSTLELPKKDTPFIGVGGTAGVNVTYNITQHHGVAVGYQFKTLIFMGELATGGVALDFGSINLGYKYTF